MLGFSSDAILLRKIEYGDHDYIISFLTRSQGKTSVIAKNAKKSIKRFSAALDLFSVYNIQCTFPKKKKDALTILSHSELENGLVKIRHDIYKTAFASFWIELVHFWLEEDRPVEELYDLLLFSLEALNDDLMPMEVVSLLFLIRFMSLSGFSPDFKKCNHCDTPLDDLHYKNVRFDFKEGCIICHQCGRNYSKYGMTVSKGTLKQLFWINTRDVERAERIRFSEFSIKEGEKLLESFIPFHIGREFKSLEFLRQLRLEK